jgi:hypothetical protein
MVLLSQACEAGYRDVNEYRDESTLDHLRDRPDFRMLMMDLSFPKQPFAE